MLNASYPRHCCWSAKLLWPHRSLAVFHQLRKGSNTWGRRAVQNRTCTIDTEVGTGSWQLVSVVPGAGKGMQVDVAVLGLV